MKKPYIMAVLSILVFLNADFNIGMHENKKPNHRNDQVHFAKTVKDYVSVDDRIRVDLFGIRFRGPFELCQTLIAIFLMVVFIQSGIDKVLNRKDNLDFLKSHFSKTIFKNLTPVLLTILTILELIGGIVLAYGVFHALYFLDTIWIFNGFVILSITLIFLMFGQRITKDYVGAADLVPYFILIMLGIMSMY